MQAPRGPLGSPRPEVFVPIGRGNTRPVGGQGHGRDPKKCGKGTGAEGGAPHSRRSAEGKKKKVEKEAFQVKLLGSEKPRFREMSRGGRTHDVPSTLLASAGPAHRGCAAAAPRPRQRARAHVERRGTG